MVRERGHRTKNRLELYLDTECILYLRVQLRMREEKPSTSIFTFDITVSVSFVPYLTKESMIRRLFEEM